MAEWGLPESRLVAVDSLVSLLEMVDDGQLGLGVVPVENSIEGSVTIVWDTLAVVVNLSILAELVLPIEHHLMVIPGTKEGDVQQVLSHPQALAQCRRYLRQHLPWAKTVAVSSTSEAARLVNEGDSGLAAIGNSLAAGLYQLEVIAERIQDNSLNATRFVLVGRGPHQSHPGPSDQVKTSVVFSTKTDRAGILYDILWEFASRKINLTRIESRPAKRTLGEYLFYLDIDGDQANEQLAEALQIVKAKSGFFKVLGTYRVVASSNLHK